MCVYLVNGCGSFEHQTKGPGRGMEVDILTYLLGSALTFIKNKYGVKYQNQLLFFTALSKAL